jgi:hypothetical protein
MQFFIEFFECNFRAYCLFLGKEKALTEGAYRYTNSGVDDSTESCYENLL